MSIAARLGTEGATNNLGHMPISSVAPPSDLVSTFRYLSEPKSAPINQARMPGLPILMSETSTFYSILRLR